MRAGHYDLVVETGADYLRQFAVWTPDARIRADEVVTGDRIYLDTDPLPIYEVISTTGTDGRVGIDLVFRQGLWDDPHLRLQAGQMVMRAKKLNILAAQAQVDVLGVHELLDVVLVDATTMVLVVPGNVTAPADSPFPIGAWSWDLYASTMEHGWSRVVEGTMAVVRGEARNPDEVPVPVPEPHPLPWGVACPPLRESAHVLRR